MKPKDILTKEFLVEHYINQRKSERTIAKEFDIKSVNSIVQARKKYGLHRCSLKDSSKIITKEFLEEYYVKKNLSLKDVAIMAGFKRKSIIAKALKKFGIPQREHTKSIKVLTRKKRSHHTIPGRYFNSIICSAKKRELSFSLTLDYIWTLFEKQKGRCALSGLEIRFHKPGERYTSQTASLDRIDSSKGYEKNNVRWVHKTINIMKLDLEDKDFVYLCKHIAHYNKGKFE